MSADRKTPEAIRKIEHEIEKLDLESEMREAEREGEQVQVAATLDDQELFTAEIEESKDEEEKTVNFKIDQSLIGSRQMDGITKSFGDQLNISVQDGSWNLQAPAEMSGQVAGKLGALGRAAARKRPAKKQSHGIIDDIRQNRLIGKISALEEKWRKHGLNQNDRIRMKNLLYGKQLRNPLQFMNPSLRDFGTKKMITELEELDATKFERTERMKQLGAIGKDEITEVEQEEQRRLQDMELRKTWLQSMLAERLLPAERKQVPGMTDYTIKKTPIHQRFGYEIKPYTRISSWDQMSQEQRRGFYWYYDNQILRFQGSITQRPQKSGLWWVKRQLQSDAEMMFDDVDSEIYAYKTFQKDFKSRQKEFEDMEEELTGYDQFTVEEEKQIQSSVAQEIREMKEYEALLREP